MKEKLLFGEKKELVEAANDKIRANV